MASGDRLHLRLESGEPLEGRRRVDTEDRLHDVTTHRLLQQPGTLDVDQQRELLRAPFDLEPIAGQDPETRAFSVREVDLDLVPMKRHLVSAGGVGEPQPSHLAQQIERLGKLLAAEARARRFVPRPLHADVRQPAPAADACPCNPRRPHVAV